jgi:hypothetical protein
VPAKVRAVLYGAFDLVLLFLIGIVIWKSWLVLVVSMDQVILGTAFSVAWPVAGMLGGLVLMFIVVVVRLVRRFMQQSSVDVRDPTKNLLTLSTHPPPWPISPPVVRLLLLLILIGIDVNWSMILSAWFGIATRLTALSTPSSSRSP